MKTENLECTPYHPVIFQKYYEINFMFYPTRAPLSNLKESLENVKTFVDNFIATYDLTNYVCFYSILYPQEVRFKDKGSYYIVASIQLSVGRMHRYKEFIFFLNNKLSEMDGMIVYDLEIQHMGQTFTTYFEVQNAIRRSYKNPMSDDIMITWHDKQFFKEDPAWKYTCLNRQSIVSTTIIAASSLCRKLVIDKRKFHVLISDFKLYFVDFDFYIPSQYFRESANKTLVEVCIEKYQIGKMPLVPRLQTQNLEIEERFLSLVCTIISSAGCVGSLIVQIFIQKTNSLPKYNMMALSLTLLLANIIYSVAKLARPYPSLCLIIGGATQCLWLGVLSLMFLYCFSVFRTFTTWKITKSDRDPQIQLLFNITLGFIVPVLMTTVNVLISRFFFLDENFGYSLSTCFISRSDLNLFTFAIPIAVIIILNIFMFLIIVREIRLKNLNPFSNSRERHTMKIYCKLSTLTGFTWLLGYFYQVFQFRVLSYLHILFTGSQGMFLFISFAVPILLKSKTWNRKTRDDVSTPKS